LHNITKFFDLAPLHIRVLILIFTTFLSAQYGIFIYPHNVLGQSLSVANSTPQTWIDKLSGIKTIFTYSPASPAIDKPTQLRFDVVQVQNGTKLDNLSARVVVLSTTSGQERSFIFPNVVSNNGSFSVTYLFPDSGSYQVISRINTKGFVTLSSFKVFVPMQAGDIVNFLVFTVVVTGIVGILAIVAIKYMQRRNREG
jgi:hypothetical protein